MTSFPSFSDFYREVNGRDPFPWQARLAETVASEGWPKMIGVPTGLGKSGCIDIAVWALASQASREPRERTLPTRIWYVVNRRLLIDAAYEHGRDLKQKFESSERGPAVAVVGEALLRMGAAGSEHGPLHITRLRGGAELGARPPDPSQPALIFGTVPMFASRWLFRGYGSSRSMRPVDAALAGIDSLILLDEAHLARALATLAESLQQCDLGDPSLVLPAARSRPIFVALTATGDVDEGTFDLDADDLANPIVRKRVDASKPVTLVETAEKKTTTSLAEQAISLVSSSKQGSTCVVFTNTPKRAREVWSEIQRRSKDLPRPVDLVLATGRMRDREADAVRDGLLYSSTGARAGRDRNLPRDRELLVVATQTLEVGADLDFDVFVSETPGVRALVQRLGRLNRLGESPHPSGAICHPSDVKDWTKWSIYRDETVQVWERLKNAASNGFVDLRPSRVNDVLGPPLDEPPRVGELLPVHLWEWAKTTLSPAGEAPVELFFQGFEEFGGRVSVCWRAHRPADGIRLFPSVTEGESVEIPIWEIADVLSQRELDQVKRLDDDRASLETVPVDFIVPGDQLVLSVSDGMYDRHGWNSGSGESVLDVSLLRSRVLPFSVETLQGLCPEAAADLDVRQLISTLSENGPEDDPLEPEEEKKLVAQLVGGLRGFSGHSWLSESEWEEFLDDLGTTVERPVKDIAYVSPKPEWRRRQGERVGVRADAFEEMSFDVDSVTLANHLKGVGETAERMAAAIGCPSDLVEAVGLAGRLHDIGKADQRFQRWLDPDGRRAPELVAKSDVPRHRIEASRVASGWPKGGRHELLSAHLIRCWLEEDPSLKEDPALLMHLVVTHHGQGRPSIRIVPDDGSSLEVEWQFDGFRAAVPRTLSRHDWDQPLRFHDMCGRYGYWGLALLEACVRQADQAVSAVRRMKVV